MKNAMTKTRIQVLAKQNGIDNAYQLQKLTSLSPSMASRLFKDEVEMIATRTIDILCNAFKCKPADLFEYTASNKKS
jgi:DNA-binding Xre family transcriptional regulator